MRRLIGKRRQIAAHESGFAGTNVSSGIEEDRHHVGRKVSEDIDGRGDENGRFDQRDVAKLDRIDEETPEARKGEDLLHDDYAADKVDEIQGHDVKRRNEGVWQCVPDQHLPTWQTLQLRHPNIFGIEHLDEVVAEHAHGVDGDDDAGKSGTTRTKKIRRSVPSRKSGMDSTTNVIAESR
jgi:hypothetical protein